MLNLQVNPLENLNLLSNHQTKGLVFRFYENQRYNRIPKVFQKEIRTILVEFKKEHLN
ncbi:hypothetical protein LEP1GSC020_0859 [Leptospira interrogans serovar Grippotyphosa str. 2006006986]|uniref:Uncharacterized protein n=2 Tax=Leptospira interrogans TaxID=173 RepID=A0A0F6ICD7_LEPIR|nr:hypothetical protein LEP1GSC080_2826 [Leptospira interrogans str. FPW2026]EKO89347.1 hypothetical protein LEP1GSC009_2822 [Leptospira interrogans serovar Grippotyphosa str. Andaman]EKP83410.1 hypothetical protein LEP1GSC020_0859 [Leptospira interrogans serovar Grippotyphosa str. 2006006986]EKR24663.1 hypothetical protein LEP1GSC087_1255 [Leptospira interrogans serovar Bataviae str. L1111]EKR84928.1 hypothetical protein LEP1GSC099_1635 [Leptospira interrogans str. UI 08452]EMF41410.1 hypothe